MTGSDTHKAAAWLLGWMLAGLLTACGGGGGSEPNDDPKVDAGDPVTVGYFESVSLVATAEDDDGSIASYAWTQTGGAPQIELSGADSDTLSFEAPALDSDTVFTFSVTVTDDDGADATDTVDVTVLEVPDAQIVSLALTELGTTAKVTNQQLATVTGLASSDLPITLLEWVNATTQTSGSIDIADSWTTDIELAEGDNALSFTMTVLDGSQTSIDTVLTYYPTLDFSTPLQLSKTVAYVGDAPVEVVAMIGTPNDAAPLVELLPTDADGEPLAEALVTLLDTGALPDEIEGDGLYTAGFQFAADSDADACFRVRVTDGNGSVYRSETSCIDVTAHYSSEHVAKSVDLADRVDMTVATALEDGATLSDALALGMAEVQAADFIGTSGLSDDSGIWWVTDVGLLGVYHANQPGQKSGTSGRGGPRIVAELPQIPAPWQADYYRPATRARAFGEPHDAVLAKADGENRIGSPLGKQISPFYNHPSSSQISFGSSDDYVGAWDTIEQAQSCGLVPESAAVNDGAVSVTLDDFKSLQDFGYISISTHGDTFFIGAFAGWDPAWGQSEWLKGALSIQAISTGVLLPMDEGGQIDISAYEDDFHAKRLAHSDDGEIFLLPGFFQHYLSSLPNSLVVLSACRSLYGNALANTFLAKGAGAVLGFDEFVQTDYAQDISGFLVNGLLDGSTVGEALSEAIAQTGPDDSSYDATDADVARPVLVGAQDLRLSLGSFENLDFETGVLAPWQKAGDGRILTQLGSTQPTDGSYMGVVSTGLGYTTQSGSLTQTACLASDVSSVRFDWNFFSEEFLEYCDSQYDDAFQVQLCDAGGNGGCVTLMSTSVNALCAGAALSPADVAFDRGDVYTTGWTPASADVSAFAGTRAELRFHSTDVGDSIYDTAILIDAIEFVGADQ